MPTADPCWRHHPLIRAETPKPICSIPEGLERFVRAGDCSILIGATLGLRRRVRFGLLFLDGHADFYPAALSPTGRPLMREADVVVFGPRDAEEVASVCPEAAAKPCFPAFHTH